MIFSLYTGMMYFPHIVSNTASEVRSSTGGPVITTKLVRVHHLRWALGITSSHLTLAIALESPTVFDTPIAGDPKVIGNQPKDAPPALQQVDLILKISLITQTS